MSPSIATSRDRKSIAARAENLAVTEREAARREEFIDLGDRDVARLAENIALGHGPATPCLRYGIANRLLRSLPPASLARILPALEPVNLVQRQILHRLGAPIEHLHFINRGLVSPVKTLRDGRTAGIGAVGIEGVINAYALLTNMDKAIVDWVVQIPGTAFRIRTEILRHEMATDNALREMVQKYAGFTINRLAQDAVCNRLHSLKERCSRWLLRAHDNALAETFPLTHEFLAMMLGVHRSGVSIAAHFLQTAGLIQYKHGHVTITNRSGLENTACECHGVIQVELENLFGTPKRR